MDRRSSVYGRLSMSTTNISSPIAESTHINGSSVNTKFPWGGKIYSPPKSSGANVAAIAISKQTMSPINKIDHRVYIDVQSRGLASRIVRYHENSSKLNRSLSMSNIYNKPGQFPIVHLKKKEIVYKPSRNQNISMVKIAPPDKSVFQANTRSSILRTGSIVPTVGLPRTDDEISRENRPILHPVGSELAPTKSVLDALREISRKRINSDVSPKVINHIKRSQPEFTLVQELDASDNIKKYCKDSDDADRGVHLLPTYNATISKRQREGPSSPNSATTVCPEQISKKRMFSKNNDVLSSLSSSMRISTPKRKFDDIHAPNSSEKINGLDSSTSPQLKQQCNETNFVSYQKIDSVLAGQITPLPPTPAVEQPTKAKDIPKSNSESIKEKLKPKLTLFNKNYDDAPVKTRPTFENNLDDFASGGIPFVKPKNNSQISETNPIIERTKKSKLALMLSGLSGELNEDDETDSRSVEKKVDEKNLSAPSVQLSLPNATTGPSASISFETKTTTATATIPTVSSTKPGTNETNSAETSFLVPSTSVKQNISGAPAQPTPSSTALSMPGLVKTTAAGGFSFPSQVSNAQTSASLTLPTTSSTTNVGSFAFPTPASKPTVAGTTNSPPVSKSPTTSAPAQPQFSFGTNTVTSSATSLPSFSMPTATQNTPKINFGVPSSNSAVVSTPAQTSISSSLIPQTSGTETKLMFGVTTGKPSAFTVVSATEGASKPIQSLGFGTIQSVAQTTSVSNSLFTTPNSNLPNNTKSLFGVPNTDSQKTENKSSGGFSFSPQNAGSDTKASNTMTPFAFSSNTNLKPAGAPSGAFSFSTPTTSAPPAFGVPSTTSTSGSATTSSIQFSFSTNSGKPASGFTLAGTAVSVAENKPQAVTSPPFSFGSPQLQSAPTSNALATNPTGQEKANPFSFGAPNATQKPTTANSIFGGTAQENKGFSFAGGDQKVPSTANSNIFESAQNTFAAPAAGNPLNFAFTPQTTSNSIFGAPTATAPANAFGAPQTAAPPSNAFGVPHTASNTFGVAQTTTSSNTFGAPQTTTSSSNAFGVPQSAASSSNTFGAPRTTTSSVFGAPTTSAPIFGATPAPAPALFGAASSASSTFGAPKTTANSVFAPSTTETKPTALAFGVPPSASNTSSSTKPFSFGGNNPTPSGGFSFGTAAGSAPNKNGTAATPIAGSTNSFTFRTDQSTNNNSVFGSPVANTTNASMFGGSAGNQSKTFNFSATSTPAAPANPFGAISAEKKNENKTFNFGATPQQPANTGTNTKPFAFGGATTNSAFAFNAPSTAAPAPTANKPFSFGGSPAQPVNQSNNNTAPFAFTSGSNGPAVAPTTQANLFSPGLSTTTTTRDRVIRIATRRLNK